MHEREKETITLHLIIRLFLILVLCAAIFGFSAYLSNRQSGKTIETVGDLYMHSMSEEMAFHVETVINLYLGQLEAVMVDIEKSDLKDWGDEELKEKLTDTAQAYDFDYLALYSTEGEVQILYGSAVTLEEEARVFLSDLKRGEKKVTSGTDVTGKKMILIGDPAPFQEGGEGSPMALVAGFEEEKIAETLSLGNSDSPVYSHIISIDGSSMIRSGEAVRDNYFQRLYDEITGEEEKYVEELRTAMGENGHYSKVFMVDGERCHLHCTRLKYTEWFLIVIMPYSSLDAAISELSGNLLLISFGGFAIILAALLWTFRSYFKEIRRQMDELDKVRQEAVEANRSKSEFLSNMSHDIRTPMNAVVGMTAIAQANIDDKEQVQNCLKKIALSGRHLLGLINDVLDMSKIESGKLTLSIDQVSLREVMDGLVNMMKPQVNARKQNFEVIIRNISTEDVCCDSVRLNQVLINLLGNSVKFTPDGGHIRMTMYEEESLKGEDYIRVHFLVEDTGIGMAPEFIEKIFESFTRADAKRVHKTEGSGLGMAITKYIIDAMGGTIDVKSELEKGSCFHVTLDLKKARVQETDMVLPNVRMLVVDDDAQLCENTAEFLKDMGIHAQWTLDAVSALAMIAEQYEKKEEYQIILSDWKLPGTDGISLAKEIRRRYGDEIPILLISAYDWSEIKGEAQGAGINGYLPKPLFKSTLFYGLRPFITGEKESAPKEQETKSAHTDLTGRRILVAEDNELNWEIARELLSGQGIELEWAENGEVCLEKFRQSGEGFYDAVLMDVRMPVMNGYEATRQIRALNRKDAACVPIIAMTADAFAEDIKRCLECGMNAHVAKPIDFRELTRTLGKYIAG